MSLEKLKTTFRKNKGELVRVMQQAAHQAGTQFEVACEEMSAKREATLLMFTNDTVWRKILEDGLADLNISVELTESTGKFFSEIGKNNIKGLIVYADFVADPEPVIQSLKRRGANVFVVCPSGCEKADLWKKEFDNTYRWPDEMALLLSDLRLMAE